MLAADVDRQEKVLKGFILSISSRQSQLFSTSSAPYVSRQNWPNNQLSGRMTHCMIHRQHELCSWDVKLKNKSVFCVPVQGPRAYICEVSGQLGSSERFGAVQSPVPLAWIYHLSYLLWFPSYCGEGWLSAKTTGTPNPTSTYPRESIPKNSYPRASFLRRPDRIWWGQQTITATLLVASRPPGPAPSRAEVTENSQRVDWLLGFETSK